MQNSDFLLCYGHWFIIYLVNIHTVKLNVSDLDVPTCL